MVSREFGKGGGLGLDPRAGGVGSPAVGQTKWCRPQPAHPFISAAPSSLVPPFYSVCGSIWVGLGRGRKGSVRAVCTREIFESRPAGSRSVGPLGAPARAWNSRGAGKDCQTKRKGRKRQEETPECSPTLLHPHPTSPSLT